MMSLQCDVNTAENLQGLRKRNHLCDIVIVSNKGQQTHAHSCILTSHSTVIATVLQNRLEAQHDWSIFRPLIINIEEISHSDSSLQESVANVNFMDILIRLMYGEEVDVADVHVATLNEYAHILGLSDKIFTRVAENEKAETESVQCDEDNMNEVDVQEIKVLENSHKKVSKEENYPVLRQNEINLTKQIFPGGLSKVSHAKQTRDVNAHVKDVEIYAADQDDDSSRNKEKNDSVLRQNEIDLSKQISPDGLSKASHAEQTTDVNVHVKDEEIDDVDQDDDSSSSKSLSDEDSVYEEGLSIQSQDCNVIVFKMGERTPEESFEENISSVTEDKKTPEKSFEENISSVTEDKKFKIIDDNQKSTNVDCDKDKKVQQEKKGRKNVWRCTECGVSFKKCGNLIKHIKEKQHFTEQCPLCFIQVEDTDNQRLHLGLHDHELPFFCSQCDLRFRTRVAVNMHMPEHMNSEPSSPDGIRKFTSASGDPDEEIVYHVIDGATQRAKRMLIDSRGFTYTVKRQKGDNINWRCANRSKYQHCNATVSQNGGNFTVGGSDHCHDAKGEAVTALILAKKVKEEACVDVMIPAATIVDKVVSESMNLPKLNYDLQFHNNLIRKAHKIRRSLTDTTHSNRDFELNRDFLPVNFIRRDFMVGKARHLIFATSAQLKLLAAAKIWILDGSYSVSCQPFMKVFSIHTYISSEEVIKQTPISFALMSKCQEKDYKEVLTAILNDLPQSPKVNTIIANFEKHLWHAAASTFPNTKLKGCAFHWGKAVWKKAQALGIKAKRIKQDEQQQALMCKVLSLPFLPLDHIETAYRLLCDGAAGYKKFQSLLDYIGNNWILDASWTTSSWNGFMQPIGTRNDEGWYRHLDQQLNRLNPVFYNVIWLLLQEAESIPVDSVTVIENKVMKCQKKIGTGVCSEIFKLWKTYLTGTISPSTLLKECGRLYIVEIINLDL